MAGSFSVRESSPLNLKILLFRLCLSSPFREGTVTCEVKQCSSRRERVHCADRTYRTKGDNMRRSDREITDRSEIDAIINSTKVMRIALADGNIPFVVPVFYVYDKGALYFHSAKSGSKIEILKKNNNVCFEISVDHGFIESDMACDFEAKHRTVIGLGKAEFLSDDAGKIYILDKLMALFSDKKFEYPQANLNSTAVIKIAIESIKGKKHGF